MSVHKDNAQFFLNSIITAHHILPFEGIFHPEDFRITLDMHIPLDRSPREEQLCHGHILQMISVQKVICVFFLISGVMSISDFRA